MTNTYAPFQAAPTPTQPDPTQPTPTQPAETQERPIWGIEGKNLTQITLPIFVEVKKTGLDTPSGALFHFDLEGMREGQEYNWINNGVTTEGEGEFWGSITLTIPSGEQLAQMIETGFDVREINDAIPGWSYSDAVYHIDLVRTGGILQGQIRSTAAASLLPPP